MVLLIAVYTRHGTIDWRADAPWCSQCKELALEFSTVAKSLKDAGSTIRLAKIDSNEATDLVDKYRIFGFPSIKLFIGGQPHEYDEGRTASQILDWLRRQTEPSITMVDDPQQAELIVNNSEFVVFGFFRVCLYNDGSLNNFVVSNIMLTMDVEDRLHVLNAWRWLTGIHCRVITAMSWFRIVDCKVA